MHFARLSKKKHFRQDSLLVVPHQKLSFLLGSNRFTYKYVVDPSTTVFGPVA